MQKVFLTHYRYFSYVFYVQIERCADNDGSEWTKDP